MPRLILADLPTDTESLRRQCGLPEGFIHDRYARPSSAPASATRPTYTGGLAPLVPPRGGGATADVSRDPRLLCSYTPYLLGSRISANDAAVMGCLAPANVAGPVTDLSRAYGGDATLALADVVHELRADAPDGLTLAGAAADVFHGRMERFSEAVERSQSAILAYREAVRSTRGISEARRRLALANAELNGRFRVELQSAHSRMSARYRTLSSLDEDRVTDMIRHTDKVSKLDIASRFEADRLAALGRGARYFGNGIAAIDFGSRISEIHDEYERGEDWERKMFIESSSFAASTLAGQAAVEVGVATLEIMVAITPAAWVLVVGGLMLAAGAAGLSWGIHQAVQAGAGERYDRIMAWTRSLP